MIICSFCVFLILLLHVTENRFDLSTYFFRIFPFPFCRQTDPQMVSKKLRLGESNINLCLFLSLFQLLMDEAAYCCDLLRWQGYWEIHRYLLDQVWTPEARLVVGRLSTTLNLSSYLLHIASYLSKVSFTSLHSPNRISSALIIYLLTKFFQFSILFSECKNAKILNFIRKNNLVSSCTQFLFHRNKV